jgi:CO/xanthine dehydrogenase Mo-binding subunit
MSVDEKAYRPFQTGESRFRLLDGTSNRATVNPLGARGIGEIGLAGIAAAITDAVHHATGVRVRELPVRIEDLLS